MLSKTRTVQLAKEIKALFRGSKNGSLKIKNFVLALPDDSTFGKWNDLVECPIAEYIYANTSAIKDDREIEVRSDFIFVDRYGHRVEIELPELGKIISEDNYYSCEDLNDGSPVTASYLKKLVNRGN